MIAAMHKSMVAKRDRLAGEQGFTLIELLVVILIIGVLAAIAIPVFIGQQQQATDAAAKANLANAKIAYSAYLVNVPAGTATPASATEITALEKLGFPQDGSVVVDTGGVPFCLETAAATFHILHDASAVATGACP